MLKKILALVVPFLGYSMEPLSFYEHHHQFLNSMLKDLSPKYIKNNTDNPVRLELFFNKTLKANRQRHVETAPASMGLLDNNHGYDSFMCPKYQHLNKSLRFFLAQDVDVKGTISYVIGVRKVLHIPIFDDYDLYAIKPNKVIFLNYTDMETVAIDHSHKKFSYDSILVASKEDRQLILPYFDNEYYIKNYKDDLNLISMNPIDHFLMIGYKKNYAINDWFDMELYQKYFPCEGNPFLDWLKRPLGVTEVKRPEEVIVTMTSYPSRMKTTWLAIESLMRQSEKPDRIVLNLYEGEFPSRVLPETINILQKRGLEINWCPENLKVFLKVIPTLEKYPNATLVAFDDDVIYPDKRLENFLQQSISNPCCIISNSIRIITFDDNHVHKQVKDWIMTSSENDYNPLLVVPEAVGGCLIPSKMLGALFFRKDLFLKLTPTEDDLWLYAMANIYKIPCYLLENSTNFKQIKEYQGSSLYNINSCNNFELSNTYFNRLLNHFKIDLKIKNMETEKNILKNIDRNSLPYFKKELNDFSGDCFRVDHLFKKITDKNQSYFYNPALLRTGSTWLMAIRETFVNNIQDLGTWDDLEKYKDRIWCARFSMDFKQLISSWIALPETSQYSYQDPRFFIFRNEIYLSAVEFTKNNIGVVFSKLQENSHCLDIVRPDFRNNKINNKIEKNWIFFERNKKLNILYTIDPMIIIEGNENLSKFEIVKKYPRKLLDFPGFMKKNSTNFTDLDDKNYLISFHSFIKKKDFLPLESSFFYTNGFAILDKNTFEIKNYTKIPCFIGNILNGKKLSVCANLSYMTTMERIDNDVFLSVGMNDTKSYIFKIPIQKIMNLLNKEQFEVKESMALSQKIAIGNVGFFGKGNIGDEMFFEIYQKMFPSLSWSAVGNDLGPLDSHFSLKDVIVIGGGDLICSGKNYRGFLHSDYPQSKPTFLFSIGGGDHLIDIKFEKKDELVDYYRSFFFNKNIKFLSVRGFKTEQTLKKVFPDLQLSGVYPDMVASIDLPYFPLKNRLKPQKLGFIWREEINKFYAEKTSNLLKLLSEYGYQTDILLLGYKNSEAERAEKETIQKFINNQKPIFKNVKNFENSDSAISGIGHYDIILSSRLHGSILATMMGIPCLSFLRGYKFQDFYSFFSQSYIIPHDEWQPDEALLLLNNTKPFTKEEILTVKKKARNGLYHLMSEIYACVSS